MKVKQLFFALLFSALGLSTLQAQNAETLRLSLSESQQYAVQHNYSLQNASLDVQKAEAAKWQTLSSMLPQVSSSFDYSNMLGYEMSMGGFRIPLNPYGTFAVTASIALSASQIMGTLMNDISVKMSDINQRQSELTTRTGVKSVYTSILVMEEVVSLLDSTLGNMLTLQEATRKSVQAGAVESIELDKLSVQVATLHNSITSNRRALKMLYSSLILQLGADGNTQLVLTTPLEQVMNVDEAARLTMGGFNMQDNNNYQLLEENACDMKIIREQIYAAVEKNAGCFIAVSGTGDNRLRAFFSEYVKDLGGTLFNFSSDLYKPQKNELTFYLYAMAAGLAGQNKVIFVGSDYVKMMLEENQESEQKRAIKILEKIKSPVIISLENLTEKEKAGLQDLGINILFTTKFNLPVKDFYEEKAQEYFYRNKLTP